MAEARNKANGHHEATRSLNVVVNSSSGASAVVIIPKGPREKRKVGHGESRLQGDLAFTLQRENGKDYYYNMTYKYETGNALRAHAQGDSSPHVPKEEFPEPFSVGDVGEVVKYEDVHYGKH